MSSKKEIDSIGYIRWFNANRQLHRENGPAFETPDGEKAWWVNGQRHRENGPAKEFPYGRYEWYQHDRLHREDGPAIVHENGAMEWYVRGQRHREDGPAIVSLLEWEEAWYQFGRLHRPDGPAAVFKSGRMEWWLNGDRHREDGPAIIYPKSEFPAPNWGDDLYYLHGKQGPEITERIMLNLAEIEKLNLLREIERDRGERVDGCSSKKYKI